MGLSKTIWTNPSEYLRSVQPENPVLFFAPAALQSAARRFIDGFPGMVTYAVKSNPSEEVVENLVAAGLRYNTVAGATATFSQDVEPEYLAWSADGSTCYVTLQENNAIAVIAAASATVTAIRPLGFKDHGVAGNELDLSDREVDGTKASGGRIDIRTWPGVVGAYLPDGIAACDIAGRTYLVTANEGDSRESGELKDEAEVADLEERFASRKAVDQAKGLLQEGLGLSEPEAFRWIQKTAMDLRKSMREVAEGVIDHAKAGGKPRPLK